MYGMKETRGLRMNMRRKVIGSPITEEEWGRYFTEEHVAAVKALKVFGPIAGSPNVVARWSEDADPLDVAAFIAATIISEEPHEVADVLRKAFGETRRVI